MEGDHMGILSAVVFYLSFFLFFLFSLTQAHFIGPLG